MWRRWSTDLKAAPQLVPVLVVELVLARVSVLVRVPTVVLVLVLVPASSLAHGV
jgi:hypothetical protein